jgi:hypothetical protein
MPAFGIVPAHDSIVITIEKPIQDHEQPVLVAQPPTMLRLAAVYRTKIIVENNSDHPIGYMMVIAPRRLVTLGRLPWQQLYRVLKNPQDRQTFIQQLMQRLMKMSATTRHIDQGEE